MKNALKLLSLLIVCFAVFMFIQGRSMKKITMGVVSSASPVKEEDVKIGIDALEKEGFKVKVSPLLYENERFLAGDDNSRKSELMDAFNDDEIDYIIEAGGGYGSMRILNMLDYKQIKKSKKILIGLSDVSALQNAIYAKTGLPSYTGFVLKNRFDKYQIPETLLKLIKGEKVTFKLNGNPTEKIVGPVIGGNLTMFVALMGTPYFPETRDAILILEEIGEKPYRIDRMLTHLELAGVFQNVQAVIFANFRECISTDEKDGTIEQVIDEWKKRIGKPVYTGFEYGHQENSVVFPIGATAILENGELVF